MTFICKVNLYKFTTFSRLQIILVENLKVDVLENFCRIDAFSLTTRFNYYMTIMFRKPHRMYCIVILFMLSHTVYLQ